MLNPKAWHSIKFRILKFQNLSIHSKMPNLKVFMQQYTKQILVYPNLKLENVLNNYIKVIHIFMLLQF